MSQLHPPQQKATQTSHAPTPNPSDELARSTSGHHVCPWWLGFFLANPLRRLVHRPEAIIHPHVREGMTVLDVGCAMGFFSVPLAHKVGDSGRVVCLDVQERMLRSLEQRATRAGVRSRIEPRLVSGDTLGIADLTGTVDFALAFAVMHEIPNQTETLQQLADALAPTGRLLVSEPKGHVSTAAFAQTLDHARAAGLTVVDRLRSAMGYGALLIKGSVGALSR